MEPQNLLPIDDDDIRLITNRLKKSWLMEGYQEPKVTARQKQSNLIQIGFWKSDYEPHFPHPSSFVDNTWQGKEKDIIIKYLKENKVVEMYKGHVDHPL